LALPPHCFAGHFGFRNQSVGGISIDAEGVVGPANDDSRAMLLALLRKEIKEAPADLTAPVERRMVSLRGLESACEQALRENLGRLPDEVRFLAGLQRIQYVFVYPEENDIVLAGPGEGWKLDDAGNVVGITTGRPVLQLDDLLVALRTVTKARTDGISVSINPTEEGYRNLNQLFDQQRGQPLNPTPAFEAAIRQAFGPQQVALSGIPADSHFARVLVAADYRMKRLAMDLEKSSVRGFPSYLELIKGNAAAPSNVNPRWWMACNYEPLAASEDGLAWELRGPGVKVMTEDDFVSETGEVTGTGRQSKQAQRWANLMTEKYDELCATKPIFSELRNLMDMCVVAALIEKEQLLGKAGLSLPLLTNDGSDLATQKWNSPKTISPEVSFLRARNAWIVTASGGVQIESWQTASRSEVRSEMADVRKQAAPSGGSFWWQ